MIKKAVSMILALFLTTGIMCTAIYADTDNNEKKITDIEPEYVFIDGYLYLSDRNGTEVKNCWYGPLQFNSDGRYTSGDEDLDKMVADTIRMLIEQNPDADRDSLLRLAYEYMRDRFRYFGRGNDAVDGENWEIPLAKVMLESGKGDCHNFSAAFWALTRGLGYPVITHVRPLARNEGDHSWCELTVDGIQYILDPQLEKNFGNDRYMITYEFGARYGYTPFEEA